MASDTNRPKDLYHGSPKMNDLQPKQQPQPMDDLAVENLIRKRYCQSWPATIHQLTKRVQAVNQQWAAIMQKILRVDGLQVSYAREGDNLVITVTCREEQERHEVSLETVQGAMPYIEVLVMDRLINSKLIAKVSE